MLSLRRILALLALVSTAIPARGGAHPSAQPETYRILTYNVQGLPDPPFDQEGVYGIHEDFRARRISQRILEGGFDIVALNEVFDDSMRTSFLNELSPFYTFIIPEFAPTLWKLQDSGLMLFSRLPMVPFRPQFPYLCYSIVETLLNSCSSAFHSYTNAAGDDALADKGIGFARFFNPTAGKFLNVFFTHMQADGSMFATPAETRAARAAQVSEALAFIDTYSQSPATEDTVVLGDLNIPYKDNGILTPEYVNLIASGGFGAAGFVDPWHVEHSPDDEGFTFDPALNSAAAPGAEERLDYILFRESSETGACFQHQTLQRHFTTEEQVGDNYVATDLSDHYGLAAWIGLETAHCSPALAVQDPTDGPHQFYVFHPQATTWLRYNSPGTYTIKILSPDPIEVTAYPVTDLSSPIKPFEGSPIQQTDASGRPSEGVVFAPAVPFYVRLRPTGATFTGDLTFYTKEHTGRTFEDAIGLDPFEEQFQEQMTIGVSNPMEKVHYMFHQHPLYSGAAQALSFETKDHAGLPLNITLYDANRVAFPGLATPTPAEPAQRLDVDPATSPVPGGELKMYFVVDRLDDLSRYGSYRVAWTTNLVRLDLKRLKVLVQNDPDVDDGYDEIHVYVTIDDTPEQHMYLGDFDQEQSKNFPSWLSGIGFADGVTVRIIEEDDFANGDWDDFGSRTIGRPPGPVSDDPHTGAKDFTSSDGGEYRVRYKTWRNYDD